MLTYSSSGFSCSQVLKVYHQSDCSRVVFVKRAARLALKKSLQRRINCVWWFVSHKNFRMPSQNVKLTEASSDHFCKSGLIGGQADFVLDICRKDIENWVHGVKSLLRIFWNTMLPKFHPVRPLLLHFYIVLLRYRAIPARLLEYLSHEPHVCSLLISSTIEINSCCCACCIQLIVLLV